MMRCLQRLTILAIVIFPTILIAQNTLNGKILDSHNKEPIPYAHILILNADKGTVSNEAGEFSLQHNTFPCDLQISFIGYESKIITLTSRTTKEIGIQLKKSKILLDEIVIDSEDPGIKIMRKVIAKNKILKQRLNSYKADVYCRTTIYGDTGVALVKESVNTVFWDKTNQYREIIQAQKQSSNSGKTFTSNMSHLPNFYADNIETAKFNFINIINPDALKFYDFKLVEKQVSGDQVIFVIEVLPINKFQPLFEGKIHVLDDEYVILNVDLQTSDYLIYPSPISTAKYYFNQQFSQFSDSLWLPVSMVREGKAKVSIPGLQLNLHFKDIYDIKKYEINIPIEDSVFQANNELQIDSTNQTFISDEIDSLRIPLTKSEEIAFLQNDTNYFYLEAMKPTGIWSKLLIKALKANSKSIDTTTSSFRTYQFQPKIWFNRVEGFHLGGNNKIRLNEDFSFDIDIAFNTASNNFSYMATTNFRSFSFKFGHHTTTTYYSDIYTKAFTSLAQLLGSVDYFNYFSEQFICASYYHKLKETVKLEFIINIAKQGSEIKHTDYSFFNNVEYRTNPPINEGWMNTVRLDFQLGNDYKVFSQNGNKRILLSVEHSNKAFFLSDFSFTQFTLKFDWRVLTFFPRRFQQHYLETHIVTSGHLGDLPIQKMGIIDGSLGFYNAFGGFNTLQNTPPEGTEYISILFNHNFRSLPMELIGLHKLARTGIEFGLHFGIGKTWNNTYPYQHYNNDDVSDNYQMELGISINKIFKVFRLSVTQQLTSRQVFVSFGIPNFI